MKFKLLKNEHGAVITHVALALSGIEREDAAQLIVSPQMALILKDKMSVKEIMTAISSMVMVVGNLAHRLVEMCEPQCETCDYDCISELLNSAVDSACMDDTELQKAKEAALAYNRTLIPGVADNLLFSEEALKSAAENYENLLNIRGDGIMGYVEIPKIDVNLPIYHGTGDDSLDRGVGHLLGSSLPVGGETSHTVLTAHSGLAGQRLFSDLDKLECGDTFYVHTLDETMAYMVLEINTVLPEDTSKLVILPEHDVCTLVTCTPYGVNTHRLMVRGTRIRNDQAEYVENLKAERNEREGVTQSTWQQEYFKGIGLGVICIAAIGIVYEINRIRPRRRKRGLHEKG